MICYRAAELSLAALTLMVCSVPGAATGLRARSGARGSSLTDYLTAITQGEFASPPLDDGVAKWIVATIPTSRCIMYVRPGDTTWRPLVMSGLVQPKSIAIDKQNKRLFVADPAAGKIYWYQLHMAPDGTTLMTDGQQHLAVQGISPRTIAVGFHGDLYVTGATLPVPPNLPVDGVFAVTWLTIANCEAVANWAHPNCNVPPKAVWNQAVTGSVPDALGLDAFNVWWGNDQDGKTKGSVARASLNPPLVDPGKEIQIKADNEDTVESMALTPTMVFYGSENAIYAVPKNKVGQDCGVSGCPLISKTAQRPTAMAWDGDGTVYVADRKQGALLMFPSESKGGTVVEKFADCNDIYGIDVMQGGLDGGEG